MTTEEQPQKNAINWPRVIVRTIIGVLVTVIIAMLWLAWTLRPEPNDNALALGESAAGGPIEIPIQRPTELDGLTRDEVFALRTEAVMRNPELLGGPYVPADVVFGQIVDGKPWWGMPGQFFYANGSKSIEGVSEEARFILNPYLLVWAEFGGFSFYGNRWLTWSEEAIEAAGEEVIYEPDFPLICGPETLTWWPDERRAEVFYDVTGCMSEMNKWLANPVEAEDMYISLAAYNARDLNLNFLFPDYDESENIIDPIEEDIPTEPVAIPHFIHLGSSCAYPGGCNNMSPAFPPTDYLFIEALPARFVVRLWHELPPSADESADMTVVLLFE